MEYSEVDVSEAYELLNPGGLVLVCTKAESGRYDLAPVAWCCPFDFEPVSRVLVVCDTGHRTFQDLQESGEFALALPSPTQRDLVQRTGTASGHDLDKYAEYKIGYFHAERIDARIPDGVSGWLECRLLRIVVEGTSGIVLGEVQRACALPDSWKARIHYVRPDLWYVPGQRLG
jgi:flavin reductase (DIM6/NTAB) family NADH-FMN oxidoreductase RutF